MDSSRMYGHQTSAEFLASEWVKPLGPFLEMGQPSYGFVVLKAFQLWINVNLQEEHEAQARNGDDFLKTTTSII